MKNFRIIFKSKNEIVIKAFDYKITHNESNTEVVFFIDKEGNNLYPGLFLIKDDVAIKKGRKVPALGISIPK